ncbi:MAG: radical SAM protein [Candidatus Omnitrophota bacterium]
MDYLKEFKQNIDFYFSKCLGYPYARPYWVYISLSHQCTYHCKMCQVVKILKGHELPKESILRTLDEISLWDSNCVVVFTGGEPFLRKDIFEIFSYAAKRGLKSESVSNGALINEKMAVNIVSSGLSNIAISLDGAREATHDSVRDKSSYNRAVQAIKNLVRAKKERGTGPQLSVWTTIMKENVEELFEIIPLVRDLGVECLVYHPVIVAQDDMQNTSERAPFWIRGDDAKKLKEQIDKIVAYQKKHGLVAFLHDPYLWLEYFEGTLTKKNWSCNPFVFINIGPDGEVRSCGSSFGSIKDQNLEYCLNSVAASKARKIMAQCQKPCLQTCWAHPESDTLALIIERFLTTLRASDLEHKKQRDVVGQALAMLCLYEKQAEEKCLK